MVALRTEMTIWREQWHQYEGTEQRTRDNPGCRQKRNNRSTMMQIEQRRNSKDNNNNNNKLSLFEVSNAQAVQIAMTIWSNVNGQHKLWGVQRKNDSIEKVFI